MIKLQGQEMMYLTIAAKLIVGFLVLLVYLNLSGRGQLAPNSAVDQIGNYVLGGIIGGIIYNPDVSILEMVIVISIWAALIYFTRVIRNNNPRLKTIIDGESLLLFDDGQIISDNLSEAKLSIRDFIAKLHIAGIHNLDELQSVWLETNNQYTILRKGERAFSLTLIENGQVIVNNLVKLHKDISWLEKQLQNKKSISEIVFAEWVPDGEELSKGEIHIYPYQKAQEKKS